MDFGCGLRTSSVCSSVSLNKSCSRGMSPMTDGHFSNFFLRLAMRAARDGSMPSCNTSISASPRAGLMRADAPLAMVLARRSINFEMSGFWAFINQCVRATPNRLFICNSFGSILQEKRTTGWIGDQRYMMFGKFVMQKWKRVRTDSAELSKSHCPAVCYEGNVAKKRATLAGCPLVRPFQAAPSPQYIHMGCKDEKLINKVR